HLGAADLRAELEHRRGGERFRRRAARHHARRRGRLARDPRAQGPAGGDRRRPRQRGRRDPRRPPGRGTGEPGGGVSRPALRRRLEGGCAFRGAGADPDGPALRPLRKSANRARVMRCGEFYTTYAADMAIFETRRARHVLWVFLAALFTVPFWATSYWLDVFNRAGIAVIAAMGLNILTGFTGQISLGNAAFLAVGAYSTAFLAGLGVPFLIACPSPGLIAAIAGMIFGIPSLRLKGLYLAMATLAAHFIVEFTATHWDAVTGGVAGISIPAPAILGYAFADDRQLFFLIAPSTIAALWFARNLFRTRVGKAFVAIRDQDISAEVMGVEVFRYKLLSFAVSSFYVGVAGSLLAY